MTYAKSLALLSHVLERGLIPWLVLLSLAAMFWPSWGLATWDPFVDAKPALDAFIALTIFPNDPTAAIPPALYTFGCMFTGSILARIWTEFGAGPEGQR